MHGETALFFTTKNDQIEVVKMNYGAAVDIRRGIEVLHVM